ncbi:MAG TPA: helix-turn-helix domain-containing protein [Blastocatellia bacterium]
MSGKICGQAWDLDLPQSEMLVLQAMADHADHQGRNVYPGIGLIAWKTKYSVRQTIRIIAKLKARGILVEQKAGPNGMAGFSIVLSAAPKKPEYRSRKGSARGDIVTSPHRDDTIVSLPERQSGDIGGDKGVTSSRPHKEVTMEPMEPVCVSRFSYEQRLKYTKGQPGIRSSIALAKSLSDGTADQEIARYFESPSKASTSRRRRPDHAAERAEADKSARSKAHLYVGDGPRPQTTREQALLFEAIRTAGNGAPKSQVLEIAQQLNRTRDLHVDDAWLTRACSQVN